MSGQLLPNEGETNEGIYHITFRNKRHLIRLTLNVYTHAELVDQKAISVTDSRNQRTF